MILHPNLFQTLNTRNQSAQGTPTTPNATPNKANTTCFNCGQKGHYANRCPSRRKSSTPTPGTPAPPSSRNGSCTPIQAQQNYAQGRVNQVTRGGSERPNHCAWYIPHQLYSVLTIRCILFFSVPKNLRTRFLLRGVVLSHPKFQILECD
jgi:hypothetical protein